MFCEIVQVLSVVYIQEKGISCCPHALRRYEEKTPQLLNALGFFFFFVGKVFVPSVER